MQVNTAFPEKGCLSTHHRNPGFTLLELIIVIIIVGILAVVGLTQYTDQIERGRLSEAKANIGVMSKFANEYYLKNSTVATIIDSDVTIGNGLPSSCSSSNYYWYDIPAKAADIVRLSAYRCTSGGKTPNAEREYQYLLRYYPGTGVQRWYCSYSDDSSSCFGLSPVP